MGRRSLTGVHHLNEQASGVTFESSLERDFITLMSFEDAVANVEEQPLHVPNPASPRRKGFVPDFLVMFTDGDKALVETKYRE